MDASSRNAAADTGNPGSIREEVAHQHQQRVMDIEEATRYTDQSTQAIVSGFRDLLLHRADRHAKTLTRAYEDAYARLQNHLNESADTVEGEFKKFVDETLVKLDNSRKKMEHDTNNVVSEVAKLTAEVIKRSSELKAATDNWEDQHKRTFQGLEKFQKEYREMIHQLDAASKRMEKIVDSSKITSIPTILAIFVGSLLGSGLAYLILQH